jgi:Fe-S cluster assembly scaffold IscU
MNGILNKGLGNIFFVNNNIIMNKNIFPTLSIYYINNKKFYSNYVINHFNNPQNVGKLNKDKKNVGTGIVGAPACGDVMKVQIEVDEKSKKIIDTKFKTFGCGSAIASSSYATELIKGKDYNELDNISNKVIAENLKLPPVKLHCSMLAEDALKQAKNDYEKKNNDEVNDR